MPLTPDDVIADYPARAIRELLRRSGRRSFDERDVQEVLSISDPGEAARLLQKLAELGYLEPSRREGRWENTVAGNQVANKKFIAPTDRGKAEALIQAFLARVEDVRKTPHFLYYVIEAAIFGSYASGSERLGDVDISIRLGPKEPDRDRHQSLCQERVSAAARAGRRFDNIVQQLFWPQEETLRFLKGRVRALSFTDMENDLPIVWGGPFRLLHVDRAWVGQWVRQGFAVEVEAPGGPDRPVAVTVFPTMEAARSVHPERQPMLVRIEARTPLVLDTDSRFQEVRKAVPAFRDRQEGDREALEALLSWAGRAGYDAVVVPLDDGRRRIIARARSVQYGESSRRPRGGRRTSGRPGR